VGKPLKRESEAEVAQGGQRGELRLAEATNLFLLERQDQAIGDALSVAAGNIGDEARALQRLTGNGGEHGPLTAAALQLQREAGGVAQAQGIEQSQQAGAASVGDDLVVYAKYLS